EKVRTRRFRQFRGGRPQHRQVGEEPFVGVGQQQCGHAVGQGPLSVRDRVASQGLQQTHVSSPPRRISGIGSDTFPPVDGPPVLGPPMPGPPSTSRLQPVAKASRECACSEWAGGITYRSSYLARASSRYIWYMLSPSMPTARGISSSVSCPRLMSRM